MARCDGPSVCVLQPRCPEHQAVTLVQVEGIGPLQEAVAEAAADRARVDQVAEGLQAQVADLELQLAELASVQSKLSSQQVCLDIQVSAMRAAVPAPDCDRNTAWAYSPGKAEYLIRRPALKHS